MSRATVTGGGWLALVWGVAAVTWMLYYGIFRLKRLPESTYAYVWLGRPTAFWLRLVICTGIFIAGLAAIVMALTGAI